MTTWGNSLTAVAVGRMIEEMAPSERPRFLKVVMEMLPPGERIATLEAAIDELLPGGRQMK